MAGIPTNFRSHLSSPAMKGSSLAELQEECRQVGLGIRGTKADLRARLAETQRPSAERNGRMDVSQNALLPPEAEFEPVPKAASRGSSRLALSLSAPCDPAKTSARPGKLSNGASSAESLVEAAPVHEPWVVDADDGMAGDDAIVDVGFLGEVPTIVFEPVKFQADASLQIIPLPRTGSCYFAGLAVAGMSHEDRCNWIQAKRGENGVAIDEDRRNIERVETFKEADAYVKWCRQPKHKEAGQRRAKEILAEHVPEHEEYHRIAKESNKTIQIYKFEDGQLRFAVINPGCSLVACLMFTHTSSTPTDQSSWRGHFDSFQLSPGAAPSPADTSSAREKITYVVRAMDSHEECVWSCQAKRSVMLHNVFRAWGLEYSFDVVDVIFKHNGVELKDEDTAISMGWAQRAVELRAEPRQKVLSQEQLGMAGVATGQPAAVHEESRMAKMEARMEKMEARLAALEADKSSDEESPEPNSDFLWKRDFCKTHEYQEFARSIPSGPSKIGPLSKFVSGKWAAVQASEKEKYKTQVSTSASSAPPKRQKKG